MTPQGGVYFAYFPPSGELEDQYTVTVVERRQDKLSIL